MIEAEGKIRNEGKKVGKMLRCKENMMKETNEDFKRITQRTRNKRGEKENRSER